MLAAAAALLLIGGPVWLLVRAPGSPEPAAPDGSRTTDAPVEWSLSDFSPEGWTLDAIASSRHGTVVIGYTLDGSQVRGWFSADGTDWEEIDVFDSGVVIRDLTSGDYGFLASGLRLSGTEATTLGDGPRAASPASTIWYSPDGKIWTETTVPLPPAEERLSDMVDHDVRRAAGNSHVMVAAGDETDESREDNMADGVQVVPSRPLVWWSEDGSVWQLVDEPAWDEATSTGAIAASGDRVAVMIDFGGEDNYATVWTSEDGRNWELAHEFELGVFCDLAGSVAGFVAACSDGTVRFSGDGSVWEPSHLSPQGPRVGLVIGGEQGFVAILGITGIDPFEDDMSQVTPVIYASSDGRRWVPISEPSTFGPGFLPTGVGSSNQGYVIVGSRLGPGAFVDQIGSVVSETWIGVPQR